MFQTTFMQIWSFRASQNQSESHIKKLENRKSSLGFPLLGGISQTNKSQFLANYCTQRHPKTRGGHHVRADQRMQGLVDVKLFYKTFFFLIHTHNYQQNGTVRHGPAWSIRGQMLFFTHFSMLSPPQDPHRHKNNTDKNKKIISRFKQ